MFKNVFLILVKWLFNKAKAMHKGIEHMDVRIWNTCKLIYKSNLT